MEGEDEGWVFVVGLVELLFVDWHRHVRGTEERKKRRRRSGEAMLGLLIHTRTFCLHVLQSLPLFFFPAVKKEQVET